MIDSALGELGFGKNISKELNDMESSINEKKGNSLSPTVLRHHGLLSLSVRLSVAREVTVKKSVDKNSYLWKFQSLELIALGSPNLVW